MGKALLSRSTLVVGFLIAALLMVWYATSAAASADPAPVESDIASADDSELEEQGVQSPSDAATSRVWRAFRDDVAPWVDDGDTGVVANVDGKPSGFGSLVVDETKLEVDIYWSGTPPVALTDVVAGHPLVTVRFHESKYSLRELIEARETVVAARQEISDAYRDLGLKYVGVGPLSDASGLKVILGPEPEPAIDAQENVRIVDALEEIAGVDVVVEYSAGGGIGFLASRQADT